MHEIAIMSDGSAVRTPARQTSGDRHPQSESKAYAANGGMPG
jgi:hypothetical protein